MATSETLTMAHMRDLELYLNGELDDRPPSCGMDDEQRDELHANQVKRARIKRALTHCVGRRTVPVLRARFEYSCWEHFPEIPARFGAMAGLVVWLADANRKLSKQAIVAILKRSRTPGIDRDLVCDMIADATSELALALLDYEASLPRVKAA